MTTNFADILANKVEETERPKPLPVGPYNMVVKKFELGESRDKKTPYVRFLLGIVSPRDGVDGDQLAQVGDYSQKELRRDFYLTSTALFMLRDFLEKALKLDIGQRTFGQCLPETQGRQVVGNVKQVPSSRPGDDSIFNEIESFQPVD